MLLSREDLWHIVNDPVPTEEEDRDEDWCSDDRKAKATIVLLLEDSQLPLVKNKRFARDVFEALKCYHEKTSRSVRVSLLKRLCAVNLGENGDLEQHLSEMDELFDRLDAAGTRLDADTKICMLLRSLPPSFDGIVSVLDSRADDEISMDIVKARLMDEFQRRRERDGPASKPEKAMRSQMSTTKSKQGKESRTCHYCKQPGHLRRNCRKYLASQRDEATKKENVKAKSAHTEAKSVAFTAGSGFSSWIIDSGASAHMTSDESFFSSLEKYEGGWITLADGDRTQIYGHGSGVLYGVDDEENAVKIEMSDVQFVPGLASSLISVSQLARKGLSVTFGEDDCKISNRNGDVVATGKRSSGLYHLRQGATSLAATVGQHSEHCRHQWHRRLGHRDWTAVERLVKDEMATGIKVSKCNLQIVCECCAEGKSARSPFPPVEERKSDRVLDIIHTDLCGPMKETTPSGNRYVMHLIDDHSRFAVTYLLKSKSEAAGNIKDFVRWVENIFGRKPRVIRSDGGGEFDNSELRSFYKKEGIVPQYTTPYSPQSNGVAERKNRSITEMATCMLLDAGLEKRFWGEAVLTATYLQNRLPSRSVQRTPYELWWGRKPDLSHVRVFGSEAFVHVPSVKRSKMESKARKLTLVGYSMEHKAYRFVDRATNQITVSRDARFIELGNGSSSVEFPVVPEEEERAAVEKVKILPLKKDGEESVDVNTPKSAREDPLNDQQREHELNDDDSDRSMYESMSDNEEPRAREVRRPVRKNRGVVPQYLNEYVLDIAAGSAECVEEEPNSVEEAKQKKVWRDAMADELESHRRNNTWELVPQPKGRKVIGSKWVFKVKKNELGQVVKCKARIVAQGFAQKYGVDFDQVYAPVTQHATFRTFLAVAAKKGLAVKHLDVKTAYLNAELEEEVLMKQPPGYAVPGQEELVCRLRRSIYGLRQSARCWNLKLKEVLGRLGFQQSTADQCLFIRKVRGKTVFLLVYVDDMLVASADDGEIKRVIDALTGEFELTCLGDVSHFLGM